MQSAFKTQRTSSREKKNCAKLKLRLECNYLNLVCEVQKISCMISKMFFRKMSS